VPEAAAGVRIQQVGDTYYAHLDMVVLEFTDLRRSRDAGVYAHVTATTKLDAEDPLAGGEVVGWAPLQLASPTSRKTYLAGCTMPIPPADLMEACRLVDRSWRDSFTPSPLVPRKPSPASWLVPGWMPIRATSIVYCDGDTGKSIFALYFAVSALAGRAFGPWAIAPVHSALYLDFEDEQAAHEERLHGVLGPANLPDPGARLQYMDMRGMVLSDMIGRVRQICARLKTELVIVDSLAAAAGGEVEGAEAAIRTLSTLRSLTGASRLVLGHVNAVGAQQVEGIPRLYGSVYNRNHARATIYLAKEIINDTDSILTAHLDKHNRGPALPPVGFRMGWAGPHSTDVVIVSAEADYSRAAPMVRIIEALRRGKSKVQQLVEATGLKENSLRSYLSRLEKRDIARNRNATTRGPGIEGEWFLVDSKRNSDPR
jgi:hypothetical protein